MNMFARFDENPAMTLRVIKETKRYGWTDGRTHGRTDTRTDNVKTVYPLQTKFAGGIIIENVLLDFSLTVKAATLIFISGCSSAISFAYTPIPYRPRIAQNATN